MEAQEVAETLGISQEQMPELKPPQENNAPPSAFDTSAERAELQSLENEINQLESALETNGAQYLAQNVSADDEELFFEDKDAFFRQMLARVNTYYNENIGSRKNRASELKNSIAQKQAYAEIEKAEAQFLSEHKDADIEALNVFVQDELAPRVRRELDNLPPYEALKKAWELYTSAGGEEKTLPKKIDGGGIPVDSIDSNTQNLGYFDRV